MSQPYLITLLFISSSLSAGISFSHAAPSPTPETSPGPVVASDPKKLVDQISAEEKTRATELWNKAMEKFAARKFRESVVDLQEYVNRYPGTPEALDARYHLGQSYLFMKSPLASIPIFISVIEMRGKSDLGNEARTYLGQAYLDAAKFTEAHLVSEELLTQENIGIFFRSKALLIRAHAQAGLNQNTEAEKTLSAFQAIADNDPELERETANSFLVSLLLKSNRCDSLPTGKSLPEDQIIDQMARKGICVLEMATLLARAAKKLTDDELSQAAETLSSSLREYRDACRAPPVTPVKVSKAKAKTAMKELLEKLGESCRSDEKLLRETFRDREKLRNIIFRELPKV